MCVSVCVCVCARARAHVRVSVCVFGREGESLGMECIEKNNHLVKMTPSCPHFALLIPSSPNLSHRKRQNLRRHVNGYSDDRRDVPACDIRPLSNRHEFSLHH